MTAETTAPYGTWPSPISAASLVEGVGRIGEVRVDGTDVWWAESRPSEGGRTQLVRLRAGGSPEDVLGPPDAAPGGGAFYVRTLAHEYGGGAWCVAGGV